MLIEPEKARLSAYAVGTNCDIRSSFNSTKDLLTEQYDRPINSLK